MKTIKLSNGDLEFDGQNNIKMAQDDDEFLQCVIEILSVNLSEWFLNPLHGFDRFAILGEKYDQERAINTVFGALMQEPRIDRVENIDLDFDRQHRNLKINFAVVKTTGETVEGGVVI